MLLLDEPTSALDPMATAKIEELIDDCRDRYTVVIMPHNMQQAARVTKQSRDKFCLGERFTDVPLSALTLQAVGPLAAPAR